MSYNINKEENDNLFKGAAILTFSVIIVKLIGFLYKLPLSYVLGDEGMGFFNSAYTVFGFFYLLCTGGIPRAVSIIIASENDRERSKKIMRYALVFFTSVGFIFAICLFVFSHAIANFIGNSLAKFSLICIAPSLTFVSASGVLRGYMNGKSKLGAIAISEVIEGLVKFIVGLALALYASKKNYSVHIISAYTVLGVTIGSFISALFLYISAKTLKETDNLKQNINCDLTLVSTIRSIIAIGMPIAGSSFISGLYSIIDLVLIVNGLRSGGLSEANAVSIYGNYTTLVVPMLTLSLAVLAPLSTAWLPKLVKSTEEVKNGEFTYNSSLLFSLTASASIPMSCVFFYFSRQILTVLFKTNSAVLGYESLSMLSVSMIFLPLLTAMNSSHEASKNVRYPLIALSFGALLKLISECFMLYICDLGIKAAPISTNLGYGVALLISIMYASKKGNVKINVYESLFLPFAISSISYFIAKSISDLIFSDLIPLFYLSVSVGLGTALYVIFSLLLRKNYIKEILKFVGIHKKTQKNYENKRKKCSKIYFFLKRY
jgi:stage V sporulation protein B